MYARSVLVLALTSALGGLFATACDTSTKSGNGNPFGTVPATNPMNPMNPTNMLPPMTPMAPPATGSKLSCAQALTCITNCPRGDSAAACINACFQRGTPKAQGLLRDFDDCLEASPCMDAEECATECVQERQACMNDRATG